MNIIGIKVRRVIRIQNFFLKSLFEKKLDFMTENFSETHKKKLEFMFFGIDPLFPKEIKRIVESGFRSY